MLGKMHSFGCAILYNRTKIKYFQKICDVLRKKAFLKMKG